MGFILEGIALGVDLLILGLCVKEYVTYKKSVKLLKTAPQLAIDSGLKNIVARQKDKKLPYAVVFGFVTPIGVPMRSVMSPSVTGVLQVIKLSEHRIAPDFGGFFSERKLIHVSSNEMPFELTDNNAGVEVVDALSAAVLDMDVVYDNYEPSSLSFIDRVFGFSQKFLQTTEEVLRDGRFITAVGELELDGQTLRLQPSPLGPLLLTTSTKSTLIKKFEETENSMLFKIFVCSSISAVLITIIVRKIFLKKKQRDERRIREALEKERKERRAKSLPVNLTIDQLCVNCNINPKEIAFLPCYACANVVRPIDSCVDCLEKNYKTCALCRNKIDTREALEIAFDLNYPPQKLNLF